MYDQTDLNNMMHDYAKIFPDNTEVKGFPEGYTWYGYEKCWWPDGCKPIKSHVAKLITTYTHMGKKCLERIPDTRMPCAAYNRRLVTNFNSSP